MFEMNPATKDNIKLCRLCANSTEDSVLNNIFNKSNEFFIQQIKELTGITLKDNPRQILPRHFCTECQEGLPRAYEFRRQIIQAQNYFKSKAYKNQLDTLEKSPKSSFNFVPLNEHNVSKAIDTKLLLDVSKKHNVKRVPAVHNKNEEINSSNISSEVKKSKKISIEKVNSVNPSTGVNFDCLASFSENTLSDDSSSEFSDNLDDAEGCDFDGGLFKKKTRTEFLTNSRYQEEQPDILKNRQFCCHLCRHPLESLICLRIHFQKQHRKEKFKCDICEEKFSTIKSLVRHFRLHEGEKEYKCHFCDLSFKYSTVRCRHERRIHSKDVPFLCFICGKTFITSTMGRDHMTVHTKERAYHCTVCKADFLRKSHLNTHYRSMTHKNNQQNLNKRISIGAVNNS